MGTYRNDVSLRKPIVGQVSNLSHNLKGPEMRTYLGRGTALLTLTIATTLLLACPRASWAQAGWDKNPLGKVGQEPPRVDEFSGGRSAATNINTEPYNGQIYCAVTGIKLGLTQPPVPVQTSIGEEKASTVAKWFGKKDKPGVVIYVSSAEYAEQVRRDPQTYLSQIIRDKSYFTFRYVEAPNQRPLEPSIKAGGPPQDLGGVASANTVVSQGTK
jgi:hypothetical protein